MQNPITIGVGFDSLTKNFSFDGFVLTTTGFQLGVPYSQTADPWRIEFGQTGGLGWKFDAISFTGMPSISPTFHNAWRNVSRSEVESQGPVEVVQRQSIMLAVVTFTDNQIVVTNLNKADVVHIGFHVKITIEETTIEDQGKKWTSPDPQVINEKMGG